MTFKWLAEPLDPEEPCGLDLDKEYDDDYIDYLDDVDLRLPSSYAVRTMSGPKGEDVSYTVFQPSSVKIKQERKTVEDLLKSTRDMRLLVILAQWEILSGDLEGFTHAIEGIALMMEAFGNDLHPAMPDGAKDRKSALEALTKSDTVIQPLQHVPLTGADDVTYRRYQVAIKAMTARDGEDGTDPNMILNELGSSEDVDETHALLTRVAETLQKIFVMCVSDPEAPFTPKFDGLIKIIADVQGLIRSARADLQVWVAPDADELAATIQDDEAQDDASDDEALEETDTPSADAPKVSATAVADVIAAGAIATQPQAKVTLSAIESYLARHEPSSAALLLVTQARLLIGRPLIEALETLLPGEANKAVIDFGPGTGFSLNMEKLRSLAAEGLKDTGASEDAAEPDPPAPELDNRSDVAAHLRAVEDFFRRNEPTSPIPLLLVRGRTYLDKDFEAIVADLIPKHGNQDKDEN